MTVLLRYEKSLTILFSIVESPKPMKALLMEIYRDELKIKDVVYVSCPHCEQLNARQPGEVQRLNRQLKGKRPATEFPDLRCSHCRKRLIHKKSPLKISHYGFVEYLDPKILQSKSGHFKNRELRELENLCLIERKGNVYHFNPPGFLELCFLFVGVPSDLLDSEEWKSALEGLKKDKSKKNVGSFLCTEFLQQRKDLRTLEEVFRTFLQDFARLYPSDVRDLFGDGYTNYLSKNQKQLFIDWHNRMWIDAISEGFLREDALKGILYHHLNHKKFREHRFAQAKIMEENGDPLIAKEIRWETEVLMSENPGNER